MQNHPEAIRWLWTQQDMLDEVLAEAGNSYVRWLHEHPNALYDLDVTNRESYRLSKGLDLCYDRPSTGVVYGMWYHARRVNTSLALALDLVREAQGRVVQVFDLGAGTGAVQWALALACAALDAEGKTPPCLKVINVDTSPFMLHYLEHLWMHLSRRLPACKHIQHLSQLNTWHSSDTDVADIWLFTSYLFDHEDKKEALSQDFDRLVTRLQPQHIIISTSAQAKKIEFLEAIGRQLEATDFVARPVVVPTPFQGSLKAVNEVRASLQKRVHSMRPAASWKDHSFTGRLYARRQTGLGFGSASSSNEKDDLSLFMPRITERLAVQLSSEQQTAAQHDGHPTLIHGPAGCGKSVVITERIQNLVESRNYDPTLRILVTTFNRSLVQEVLYKWLQVLLGNQRVQWRLAKHQAGETCYLGTFKGSKQPNIYLLHFDVLPTRLGLVHKLEKEEEVVQGDALAAVAERALANAQRDLNTQGYTATDLIRVQDPDFLLDEYHRVYYGLYQTTEQRFLTQPRPGRPRFNRNSKPRRALWECIVAFKKALRVVEIRNKKCHCTTFTERRRRFFELLNPDRDLFPVLLRNMAPPNADSDAWLDKQIDRLISYNSIGGLLPGDYVGYFTHVFVDEMQDCTQTDYAIFYRLLADPNELVVAGDLAQAVHMGRSASSILPRLRDGNQKDRRTHELQGSYRLPFRISEAVVPLSKRIALKRDELNDQVRVSLQNPYRGSPPGARPIVVWAEDEQTMAEKIRAIYAAYGTSLGRFGFELGTCSVLEQDIPLRRALAAQGLDAETNTILRLKGLEKTCVVWSTRVYADSEEDVEEYVYTILTRSAALLIIALFPSTHEAFFPVLNTFVRDRVIVWDQDTEAQFDSFCIDRPLFVDIEEHTDPTL